MYLNGHVAASRLPAFLLTLACAGIAGTFQAEAQGGSTRADGRLVLRVEWDTGGPRGPTLHLPRGGSATFSGNTLLTGGDFAQLIKRRQGDSSYMVVGMLLPKSVERLKTQSARLVGRRVGVIVDGALVGLWRVEAPLAGRTLPIVTGANDSTASFVAQSLYGKR